MVNRPQRAEASVRPWFPLLFSLSLSKTGCARAEARLTADTIHLVSVCTAHGIYGISDIYGIYGISAIYGIYGISNIYGTSTYGISHIYGIHNVYLI